MRAGALMLTAAILAGVLFCGCGNRPEITEAGTGTAEQGHPRRRPLRPPSPPAASQNGAMVVSLATTATGATIYYTVDGATPTVLLSTIFRPVPGRLKPDRQGHRLRCRRTRQQRHQPKLCAQHSVRHARLVRRIFQLNLSRMLSPTRRFGLTTPATAASATMNLKTIARGDRMHHPAARPVPAPMWALTATCTSSLSKPRPAPTHLAHSPRRGSRVRACSAFNTAV